MTVEDSQGAADLPKGTEKAEARTAAAPSARRRAAITPRAIAVGGAVALIGVAVAGLFLWMVPNAAARELQAACRGLRAETTLNPALCPNGAACTLPVAAPDFTAKDITGKDVKLSDFRGKVVLVNFWASWCGVCKTEKPSLRAMAADMVGKDFVVLAVASDHNRSDALAAVLDVFAPGLLGEGAHTDEQVASAYRQALPDGTPFKVLIDPPDGDGNIGRIAASWGITAVPESALIDRQGNIRAYFGNKRDWQLPVAQTCLRSIIDGE